MMVDKFLLLKRWFIIIPSLIQVSFLIVLVLFQQEITLLLPVHHLRHYVPYSGVIDVSHVD